VKKKKKKTRERGAVGGKGGQRSGCGMGSKKEQPQKRCLGKGEMQKGGLFTTFRDRRRNRDKEKKEYPLSGIIERAGGRNTVGGEKGENKGGGGRRTKGRMFKIVCEGVGWKRVETARLVTRKEEQEVASLPPPQVVASAKDLVTEREGGQSRG